MPRPKLHLIRFHGVLAPNAKLRAMVVPQQPVAPALPFGGVKGLGIGRFGGKAGIAEFTELRWITMQTTPRQYPF